jgi:PAS domain S-box-containing protein
MHVESGGSTAAPRTGTPHAAEETALALFDAVWLAPVGIALLDRALRFVEVNAAFAKLTGLAPAEHAGKTPRDLFPGQEDLGFLAERRVRHVLESGEAILDLGASSRALDGVVRTWRASLYPVRAAGGEARGVCAVVDETTHVRDHERELERAKAEAERSAGRLAVLQRLAAGLSAAVEPAEVGAVVVAHVPAAVGADAVCLRTLEADGLVPLASWGVRDGGDDRPRPIPPDAHRPAADALRSEQGIWLESLERAEARYPDLVELARAEGYASCAALPLRTRGRPLGTLSVLFRGPHAFDLEERALLLAVAEQCAQALDRARLFAAERAQRAAAERDRAALDGIFENAPLGVALLDRDLRFVRVNPVLAEMNGATPEAHAGRSPEEVIPTLVWEEMAPALRRVLESGVPRIDVPVAIPGDAGRPRRFLEAWYPVRAGGRTVGLGTIVREVTAEREAEEFQRHVLGIVGHDLRTPLSAVANAAHLLRQSEPLTARQARLVAHVASGTARISQIAAVLLDYAQVQGGRGIPVRRRACDLAELCRAVAQECEGANPGREVRCGGDPDAVGEWDEDRVYQALVNLVSNAVEYSAPGTVVELGWRCRPDEVGIEVANACAAPIPPETLARMFEPFRRGKRERLATNRGLGLGLFIARAIVVAHAGQLDVRSEGGRTAFTVRLPRLAPLRGDGR